MKSIKNLLLLGLFLHFALCGQQTDDSLQYYSSLRILLTVRVLHVGPQQVD